MASGRDRYLDRGRTYIVLARCRPEWRRARRLDPAGKRLARCAVLQEEALEIRRDAAARDDHGQASFVRRCEGKDGPLGRTSPAQSSQQSGREFSSADATTRADHDAFQLLQAHRFLSVHDQVSNLFHIPYPGALTADFRRAWHERAFATWREISMTSAIAESRTFEKRLLQLSGRLS